MGEYWRDVKAALREEGADRRAQALRDFVGARRLLSDAGLSLTKHSEKFYSVSRDIVRIYEVYPGNRRIVSTKGAPFLDLPDEWTLIDVAKAVIEAV